MDDITLKPELRKAVLDASVSKTVSQAIQEWDVIGGTIDETQTFQCICNQEGLRYLYSIRNRNTGEILFPIGSSCVEKFGIKAMDEDIKYHRRFIDLLIAYKNAGKFIDLSLDIFSPIIIELMYEDGCFKGTSYNNYNPEMDYQFILTMRRKQIPPTGKQRKKIIAIVMSQIKPYLDKKLIEYNM